MESLTCEKAKCIPIVEYLAKLGFKAQYVSERNHWYFSPFRDENHASFKVNVFLNLYYDFGEGSGGNLIDLGIRLHKCSVAEFLQMLAASNYTSVREGLDRTAIPQDEDGKIKIIKVDELADKSLLAYLDARGINLAIARTYCKQADFTIGHRKYIAIAFVNRSGGYELRNPFMKVCSSPKDITLIDNGSKDLKTVEGFIDFLSLLTMHPKDNRSFNYLILNSVNLLSRALEIMGDYKNIFTYYDQDTSGRKATELVSSTFQNAVDASVFYSSSEDLNDYWITQRGR